MRRKVKYASQLTEQNYAYIPTKGPFTLDWDKLQGMDDTCFAVILDRRQIAFILRHLSTFAAFAHFWGMPRRAFWDATLTQRWDDIQAWVAELENCLMSGCDVTSLVKSNLLVAAALSGQSVDLDADLDTLMTGVKDYSGNSLVGIKTAIENIQGDTDLSDILAQLLDAINVSKNDLEDDLANVWKKLEDITTVLGGNVSPPPDPL